MNEFRQCHVVAENTAISDSKMRKGGFQMTFTDKKSTWLYLKVLSNIFYKESKYNKILIKQSQKIHKCSNNFKLL